MGFSKPTFIGPYDHIYNLEKKAFCSSVLQVVSILGFLLFFAFGTQRAKFSKKVHKPALGVNVIDFELNVLNASIWVPWSPSESKKLHCLMM